MSPQLQKLLCVEPSSTQQAIVQQMARQYGLQFVACTGEAEALRLLEDDYALMVLANELADGDSLQLIEAVRLSIETAMLPVAFVTGNEDRALANVAMRAGATEVFLRRDTGALRDFIAGYAAGNQLAQFSGRVLLLEDSESHAAYIAHLCRALGLEVDVCASVKTGLERYRRGKYQLLIVDVVLEGIQSGISLVRDIRERHLDDRQPILVMSGYDDLPRRLLALKSGADDFISKPFSPEEFVWRLTKILRTYALSDAGQVLPIPEGQDFMSLLSLREREIAEKILAAKTDKEIASEMGISFWTVRSHIEQIFIKTGAHNRRDLIVRYRGK
jgi:two-component system cell cycle response regulator